MYAAIYGMVWPMCNVRNIPEFMNYASCGYYILFGFYAKEKIHAYAHSLLKMNMTIP